MSKFSQTIEGQVGKTVKVVRTGQGSVNLFIDGADGRTEGRITINPQDDAALALAVMNAAHGDKLPSWDRESAASARQEALNWLITAQDREAKEAEQANQDAARDRRRDELANEITDEYMRFTTNYSLCHDGLKAAIDRIIDLEEAQK